MNADFRPSTAADAGAIAALCQRVLQVPAGSPMFSAEQMFWKYWSPGSDWSGSRGYVLTAGERLLAHGAVRPLHFSVGGRSLTLLHLFDWAAESAAVGSGAALLRRIATLADGLLILGGSAATRAMTRPLGFRALPPVTRYAVPAGAPQGPIGEGYTLGLPGAPVEEIGLARTSSTDNIVLERSVEVISELLRCPVVETDYRVVSKSGRPLGFFLIAFAASQARIVDVWSSSLDLPDRVALLRLARRLAGQRTGVAEVVCLASDRFEEQALQEAGFSSCGTLPLFVLAPPDVVPDQARIHLHMMDGDIAFLHHGAPERWSGG